MKKIKTPRLVLKSLANNGVTEIFHLPGSSIAPIYGAIEGKSRIKPILLKHEQAACFAATGYALTTNKPGICMVMGGPGITNLVSAVAECYYQSVPLVFITVDHPRENLGSEGFHEIDSFTMLSPITKKIITPKKASDVEKSVADAISIASSGRPGPVYLNIPNTIIDESAPFKNIRIKNKTAKPSAAQIAKSVEMIKRAENPMLFLGSGVIRSSAEEELKKFIKLTGIPALSSLGGRNSLPPDFPLSIGMPPYTFNTDIINRADLFIVLGARLNPVNLRMGMLKLPEKIIRVDIDNENPRFRKANLYIKADIKEFLNAINKKVASMSKDFPIASGKKIYEEYQKAYNSYKNEEYKKLKKDKSTLTSKRFLLELSDFIKDKKASFFTDSIWIPYSHLMPEMKHKRAFFSTRSFGCLGFALPAAIGASFSQKDRKIISLSGDGGFMFNCQDLSTAADYRLKNFVQIILNNNGYSSLNYLANMKYRKQDDYYMWKKIDFSALSKSMGVKPIEIKSPSGIKKALKKVFSENGPHLINVITKEKGV